MLANAYIGSLISDSISPLLPGGRRAVSEYVSSFLDGVHSQLTVMSPTNSDRATSPAQKRQRAKQACEPCRLRKRRCDGNLPCNMCSQFDYKCYFERHPRKRSKIVEQHAIIDGASDRGNFVTQDTLPESHPTVEDLSKIQSMEANSGLAFTRLLGMRLDPSAGPKLFTFGWNVGTSSYLISPVPPITEFVSQEELYKLALLYFDCVHPLYGFLDKGLVLANIPVRWSSPQDCAIPDHLFAGIVAAGTLFSRDPVLPAITRIVELQKNALEQSSVMQPPTLTCLQSWLVRCIYLRATDHPHAVWVASSVVMHLIESAGLQLEASSSILHPARDAAHDDPEIRRRVFWIARMLNSWVSFEYGRTRVALRGITAKLPSAQEGDFTLDYINLYGISCCLDPERSDKAGQWEDFLAQVDAFESNHDGITLSRANLGLAGYRRLRLANPNMSQDVLTRIINVTLDGLSAARRLAEAGAPWWHVANVPFQTVCCFLAMDTRESLMHVGDALRALEYVVERFHSSSMREALKTARFLVRLSKKRKDEDSIFLSQSLKKEIPPLNADVPNGVVESREVISNTYTPAPSNEKTPGAASSGDEWNLDVLNGTQFDCKSAMLITVALGRFEGTHDADKRVYDTGNYFLTAELPAFDTFAPDGLM
ncbi:hypothetical protein MRB53_037720 [Persea americana]|nr:hypothetical protein MRB53_037720 [Persea americana]